MMGVQALNIDLTFPFASRHLQAQIDRNQPFVVRGALAVTKFKICCYGPAPLKFHRTDIKPS